MKYNTTCTTQSNLRTDYEKLVKLRTYLAKEYNHNLNNSPEIFKTGCVVDSNVAFCSVVNSTFFSLYIWFDKEV